MITGCLLGIAIGCISTFLIFKFHCVGDLRVDTSDPDDGPYLFLELSTDVHTLMQKKYVLLRVNVKNYISQD